MRLQQYNVAAQSGTRNAAATEHTRLARGGADRPLASQDNQ